MNDGDLNAGILRKNKKRYVLCILILTVLSLCCACEKPVDREPEAEKLAREYVSEKYGDALSYTGIYKLRTSIIGGEAYWEVYFTDKQEDEFSPDWSVDYGVDEILEALMTKEETRKGWISFNIIIPEREREVLDTGRLKKSLSGIQIYSEKCKIWLTIYEDEIYDSWDEIEGFISALEQVDLWEDNADE